MTPKTVAIGAALVLVGVLLGMNFSTAEAQRDGPYALSAGGGSIGGDATYAWRMNLPTGEVSLCVVIGPQLIFSTTTLQGEIEKRRATETKALREGGVSEEEITEYLDKAETEVELMKKARKAKANADAKVAEIITPKCSPWGPAAER